MKLLYHFAMIDTDAFRAFEHDGWQRATEHYADAFGMVTIQAAGPLLDAVAAGPGIQLLDVATGPGFVAAAAAARGARVAGLDFCPAMIAAAAHRYHEITFREGDAEALPFDRDAFDAVVMNFGLLHLSRPEAAIEEALRVLRPGGRFGLTVWAPPDQAAGFGIVLRAIERFGRLDVGLPEGPPFFRFSSHDECRNALQRAGFRVVTVRTIPLSWTLSSPDDLYEAVSRGGVRTAATLRLQTPDALAAIRAAIRESVESYRSGGGIVLPMPAVLATGSKG
jgi:ubiquinone/menaquinone biosynthesis C-methylase UbiE